MLLLLVEALAGHHYSDGIQACGADVTYSVQTSIFSVLREIVTFLGAPPRGSRPDKGKGKLQVCPNSPSPQMYTPGYRFQQDAQ